MAACIGKDGMLRKFLGGIFRRAPAGGGGGGRRLDGKEELAVAMQKLGRLASPDKHTFGDNEPVHITPEEVRTKAATGCPHSLYNYGLLLQHGHGVERDPRAALRMFRDAAAQRHPWAQYSLAHAFSSGVDGVLEPDFEEAFKLFHLASQANIPEAFAHLGNMYENGVGTDPDLDEAVKYYMHAAALGDENSKAALAKIAYDKRKADPQRVVDSDGVLK